MARLSQAMPGFISSSMVSSNSYFCYMMGTAVMHCRASAKPGRESSFILALLVYFGLYMVGEAHVYSRWQITCVYFWLLLSAIMLEMQKDDITWNRQVKVI